MCLVAAAVFGLPALQAMLGEAYSLPIGLTATLVFYMVVASDFIVVNGILRRLVSALYDSAYREAPLGSSGSNEERAYRVTCYKCCESLGSKLWAVFVVSCLSIVRRRPERIREAIGKLRRGGVLLYCVKRYGWENDRKEVKRTTLILRVVRDERRAEGFAGKVLLSTEVWAESVDNPIVNDIIADVPEGSWPAPLEFEKAEDSLTRLEGAGFSATLDPGKWDCLRNFMLSTNTNLHLLLAINPRRTRQGRAGVHCNHFIGFKIYQGDNEKIWGVVTADALDKRPFREIIGVKSATRSKSHRKELLSWLGFLLRAFSKSFSGVVSKEVQ